MHLKVAEQHAGPALSILLPQVHSLLLRCYVHQVAVCSPSFKHSMGGRWQTEGQP